MRSTSSWVSPLSAVVRGQTEWSRPHRMNRVSLRLKLGGKGGSATIGRRTGTVGTCGICDIYDHADDDSDPVERRNGARIHDTGRRADQIDDIVEIAVVV